MSEHKQNVGVSHLLQRRVLNNIDLPDFVVAGTHLTKLESRFLSLLMRLLAEEDWHAPTVISGGGHLDSLRKT